MTDEKITKPNETTSAPEQSAPRIRYKSAPPNAMVWGKSRIGDGSMLLGSKLRDGEH
jgi:hypothetical protein